MPVKNGPWKPGTKTQEHMLPRFRGISPQKRMQTAVDRVLHEDISQAQAARECGVSASRLNQHVRKAREQNEAAEARSEQYAEKRAGRGTAGPLDDQKLVVPPIGEFVRKYFDGFVCWNCNVHHEVPKFHDEMLDTATDDDIKRLLINLPPGHAKSTMVTVFSTIYEIVKNRNSMTGIVSASSDLATSFVRQIAELLTVPEMYEHSSANLIDDYGPFREGDVTWTDEMFYVSRRFGGSEKDATVKAYGIGSRLYGPRLHRMVLDDIADTDNQVNPDQVAKQLRKISRECNSRVGPNGKIIIVGTRVMPGDVYTHLLQFDGYKRIRYPVIIDDVAQTTLWPEHFSYANAQAERHGMTAESFELIWQNSELPSIGATFTQDQIDKCHDKDRVLGDVPANTQLIVGIDPAGAGDQAGYTAMVLIALDRATGMRYLVDIVNHKQMRPPALKQQILTWAERYNLYEIRVESNGLQSQLVQYNQDLLFPLANMGVRVTGHNTHGGSGRGGKWDPDWGVGSMGPRVHNRQLSLPWGNDANTRKKVGQLEKQMVQFPSKTTPSDILMALWFAEIGCRDAWIAQSIPPFDPRTTRKWPRRITMNRKVVDFGEGVRLPTNAEVMGYSMWSPHTPPERLIKLRSFGQEIQVDPDDHPDPGGIS